MTAAKAGLGAERRIGRGRMHACPRHPYGECSRQQVWSCHVLLERREACTGTGGVGLDALQNGDWGSQVGKTIMEDQDAENWTEGVFCTILKLLMTQSS